MFHFHYIIYLYFIYFIIPGKRGKELQKIMQTAFQVKPIKIRQCDMCIGNFCTTKTPNTNGIFVWHLWWFFGFSNRHQRDVLLVTWFFRATWWDHRPGIWKSWWLKEPRDHRKDSPMGSVGPQCRIWAFFSKSLWRRMYGKMRWRNSYPRCRPVGRGLVRSIDWYNHPASTRGKTKDTTKSLQFASWSIWNHESFPLR